MIGVCGGYQMLGERLIDELGDAGDQGMIDGLSLLPATTLFQSRKTLRQVVSLEAETEGPAYEIHMGETRPTVPADALNRVRDDAGERPEGMRLGNVWGTYLHGWFDSPSVRRRVTAAAGISAHRAHPLPWAEQRRQMYREMAAHVARYVNLDSVKRYLGL